MINKIRFLTFLVLMLTASIVFAAEPVAKVIKVTGDVYAVPGEGDKRVLSRGADVYEKDSVVTSALGLVSLRFNDGTLIELAPETEYAIHTYAYNEAKPKDDKFESEIIKGGFRAITGKIGDRNPTAFSATARMTTLSIRGTAFYYGIPTRAECIPGIGCIALTAFVVDGGVSLATGEEVVDIGDGSEFTTFQQLDSGEVRLTRYTPVNFLEDFPTPIESLREESEAYMQDKVEETAYEFVEEVAQEVMDEMGMDEDDVSAVKRETTGGGASSGDDPCGAVKALQQAM